MSTAVDTSKQCVITNKSNTSSDTTNPTPTGIDFVVGTPIDTSFETENSTGALLSSAKNFEILSLLSDSTSTVITAGNSGTVTLDRSQTDNGVTSYEYGYELIISSSSSLVPLANLSVSQNIYPQAFDPITLTADDFEGMAQTQAFYQTIAAYPTSTLAQNYAAAITKTSEDVDSKADGSDGSTQAISDAIGEGQAAFFANTDKYKKVTADQICLLEFYYDNFPCVWASYDSATYYLYSNSDDGSTTIFAGTLSLQKPAAIDITLPNGGYTCTFNPAVNPSDLTKTDVDTSQAKTLTYSDGLFTEDNSDNPDLPYIALKGMFGLKRTFTKNTADNTVIVIISGTVNQLKTLGFDESQAKTPDDTTQDWLNSLFHPTTAAGIFNSVMTILGALMMLHFVCTTLYGIGKWIKKQLSGPEPKKATTSDDFQQMKKQISDQETRIKQLESEKLGNKNPLPEDTLSAQNQLSTETPNLSDKVTQSQVITQGEKMDESLKQVNKYRNSLDETDKTTLDNSATKLRESVLPVETATNPEELKPALDNFRTEAPSLGGDIVNLQTKVSTLVEGEEKQDILDNQTNMKQVNTDIEDESEVNELENQDVNDGNPNAEDIITDLTEAKA